MDDVTIYIITNLRVPRVGRGCYCYILECIKDSTPYTIYATGQQSLTNENKLVLTALLEALKRIKKPCSIRVITECESVFNSFHNHWFIEWKKNQWKNAKGTIIKNHELWERLAAELQKHIYTVEKGVNSYKLWQEQKIAQTLKEEEK